MVTQGVHQALIQSRKAGGQCYDTWILPATHTVAKYMLEQYQEHTDQAMKLRDERQLARKNSLEPPPALPNPASDLLARLVHQLTTNDLGPNAKQLLEQIWKHIQDRKPTDLLKDVSYVSVSAVSEGESTRLMIGMRGWSQRSALMSVLEQLGSEVRYSAGGAPPGYMERQLGEYCRELKEWEDW